MFYSDHFNDKKHMLLHYPNVVGVGFGWKEISEKVTNIPALRVYVRQKLSSSKLNSEKIIPKEIGTIATDIISAKNGYFLSGNGSIDHSRLMVGSAISNLNAVLKPSKVGDSGLGTMGFLATVNGTTTHLDVVLVSNYHVIFAHGAQPGDSIYQPAFTYRQGTYRFYRDALNAIAEIQVGGKEGNYRYAYPNEDPQDYFIDCASARLFNEETVQAQTQFTVSGIKGESFIKGIARVQALDVLAGRELRVYKRGQTTGLTVGRVVDVAAPVLSSNQEWRQNNLVIRLEPQRGESCFADEGDSGALVLDGQNRAVGLLWGKNPLNPREAFASHLHPILDCLNVTLLTYDPFRYSRCAHRFIQSSQSHYSSGGRSL